MTQRLLPGGEAVSSGAEEPRTRPLRVAMVTARAVPEIGGIESHVAEVSRRLVADGADVTVLATDRSGALPREERVDGVPVRRFPAYPRRRDWYLSPRLAAALVNGRYDLVHVQGIHTLVPPLAMLCALLTRTPYVVTFHTGGHSSSWREMVRHLQFRVLAPLLRRAEALIGVSEFEARRFEEVLGAERGSISVVRNGGSLPAPQEPVARDPDLVLSVGRLEAYKGHHRVIAALPALLKRRPGARLVIVGAGPYEAELRELALLYGVANRVEIRFVPPADRAAMGRLVASAGAVALLSDYEAHPVAVMEALTVGTPVVVARTSGLTEMADLGWAVGVDRDAPEEEVAAALDRQLGRPRVPDVADLPTWETCSAALAGFYGRVPPREQRGRRVPGVRELPPPPDPGHVTRRDPGASGTWWRRRPLLASLLVSSAGLLLQCLGYAVGWQRSAGRLDTLAGLPVDSVTIWTFYLGLLMVVMPFVLLLTSAGATRSQRVWGSLGLTHLMYLSWFTLSPLLGIHFDENLRVTNLVHLLDGQGSIFEPNAMLPVSPYYPGLELTTTSIAWLTGFPLVVCQVLVVVIARTILVLSLFGLFSAVSGSDRVASIGIALYAANPQFYFFDAQFNYDTLAVALAALTFWAVLRLERMHGTSRALAWSTVIASLACLTITHHLGSWLTVGALSAWAVLHWFGGERDRARRIGAVALVGVGLTLAWATAAGSLLPDYLLPLVGNSWEQLVAVVEGQGGGRQVFADSSGAATPWWQMLLLLGSSAAWSLLLVVPALLVLTKRLLDDRLARWLPLAVGGAYPVLLLMRVSPNAAEVSVRVSAYVLMASSLLIAVWLGTRVWRRPPADRRAARRRTGAIAVVGAVMIVGGVVLGAGPNWEHQNGPFIPAAQHRSVDKDTIAFARWAQRYLPSGSRFAADTTLHRLVPNYADATPVTYLGGSVNVAALFMADSVGPEEVDLVTDGRIDFVVVDTRLADRPSPNGSLYEPSDTWVSRGVEVTSAQLGKLGETPGFEPVLEQGPIVVYDVRSLTGQPRLFVDRGPATALPGGFDADRTVLSLLLLTAMAVTLRRMPRRRPFGEWVWRGRVASFLAVFPGTLMVLSLVGFGLGYPPVVGSLVLGAVVLVFVGRFARWVRREPVPEGPRPRRDRLSVVLAAAWVALVVLAVTIAALGQWQGLLADPPVLPPPPGAGT